MNIYSTGENMAMMSFEQGTSLANQLLEQIQQTIFGQEDLICEALCCLLSGGHILMTGAPGLAKTTLVRVFASHLQLDYGRIQFTPDLLPTDILGSEVLNMDPESGRRSFDFVPGPVFANLLLADEINRASPRTQSALLEAMQEKSCTVAGKSHKLPNPFMVFATQNPFESEGAFPLPEAQLDRFLIHTLVDYPNEESEKRILKEHATSSLVGEMSMDSLPEKKDKITLDQLDELISCAKKVEVDDEIIDMINNLVRATRPSDSYCSPDVKDLIWYGAGPRAGISLISTARSYALLSGSSQVRWAHVARMAKPVLRHRIRLNAQARRQKKLEDDVIDLVLKELESKWKVESRGQI